MYKKGISTPKEPTWISRSSIRNHSKVQNQSNFTVPKGHRLQKGKNTSLQNQCNHIIFAQNIKHTIKLQTRFVRTQNIHLKSNAITIVE